MANDMRLKFRRHLHVQSIAKCVNKDVVTILACGNASGKMLPANFIVKGKTKLALKSWDTETAPVGSYIGVSDSEWTKQNLNESFWSTEKKNGGRLPLSSAQKPAMEEENDKNGENLAEVNGENGNTEEIQTTVTQDTEPNIDDLIQQGATLVDLGIHISDDGTIKTADSILSSGNNSEAVCPPIWP
ncbi:hypothetical protein KUTeg_008597 [Tegillarca granosa]|uniref:Uncharacterized protein n=1 Tax=Tegillarca granosa TaxID=220873 RepID=A0ABQ9FCT3_TEGGR|nr:hypothetical protein KUTeg_008597 [Tegillarca granosa]